MDRMELAKLVRQAGELYAKENSQSGFNSTTLRGMCAISSFSLQSLFEKHGFKSQVYEVQFGRPKHHHTFVVTEDNFVYDTTASQFGKENVLVAKYPYWMYKKPWKIHKDLYSAQDWREHERPTPDKIEQILYYTEKFKETSGQLVTQGV